ncbi:RNA polymerase sigma-70 factor [Carboxylicivirga sp. A043]|uniref:RNA polymerase sigma-70 factor n=1 Tax=Carboxylicivirga litoralis TaxID=2816963 RepID=UPI0021CAF6DA|nr:RNA polymerase sigma-70 factor [Carboxylicivirga sp. A043]MCU4155858.1 RNA polymerase sigma-70 factor [Carboxylicivirga sp. A043]
MLSITEEQIGLISKGNEQVFKKVFEAYYPKLVGIAMKYIKDLPVAEDIVSDVFRKIWEKKKYISEVGSFESFMHTSVRNAVFNHIRNSKRKDEHHQVIQKELLMYNFDEIVIEENVHQHLYNAIKQLPTKGRRVFELSVLHGLKESEIAEDLGISINTVKTHKKRALKDLRQRLGKYYIFLFFYL